MTDETNRAVVMHSKRDSMMRQSMEQMGIFDAQALQSHGYTQDTKHVLTLRWSPRFFELVRPRTLQRSSPLSGNPFFDEGP